MTSISKTKKNRSRRSKERTKSTMSRKKSRYSKSMKKTPTLLSKFFGLLSFRKKKGSRRSKSR